MPKNIIPKDNNPKTYEVREVESQIPSFDEFMKDYEQEQVNYSDLTHADIGSSRKSGPCSWNNPNCSCYASQGYTPLRMACPSGSNTTASNWYHSSSGYLNASDQPSCGTLLISGQGQIRCANCGVVENWSRWSFKTSSQYSYSQATSSRTFLSALNTAMGMYNDSNSREVIRQLVTYLMRS